MTSRAETAGRQAVTRRREGTWIEAVLAHLVFAAVIVFFLAPFVWLVTAAFDADAQAYIRWPSQLTLDNFARVFTDHDFGRALGNSALVAGLTMLLDVVAVSLAGYSLSRMDLRFKSAITYGVLLLQTMPLSATMVPIYGLARAVGLRNSYLGLILIHAAIELPFRPTSQGRRLSRTESWSSAHSSSARRRRGLGCRCSAHSQRRGRRCRRPRLGASRRWR